MNASIPRSFDLKATEEVGHSGNRSGNYTVRAIAIFLILVGAVGLYFAVPLYARDFGRVFTDSTRTLGFVGLLVALAFVATAGWVLAATFRHGGRGPTSLDVEPTGFTLRWDDGSAEEWRWSRLRLSVSIKEYGEHPGLPGAALMLRSSNGWAGLTHEGLDAILESAKKAGVRVRTYDQTGLTIPFKLIVIDRKSTHA